MECELQTEILLAAQQEGKGSPTLPEHCLARSAVCTIMALACVVLARLEAPHTKK